MSLSNEPLEVIVFGNRAVGKTSLLSSMYMQMDAQGVTSCNGMTFSPVDNEEFNLLRNKWIDLRKTVRDNEFTSAPVIPYNGTIELFNEHDFEFATHGNKCVVKFVDTKGGATGDTNPELISRINKSFLTLCVVDASILMQCDDIVNEELNCPMSIKRILMKVLDDGDGKQPMSCMFILTKCEKYMRTPEERKRMGERFEKVFASVLQYAAEKRFPLFYLPVQTMGCVEFSRIDPITKEMKFKTVNKEFQPVDVIFPLAHLLKVFLQILYNQQQNMTTIQMIWQNILAWWYGRVKEDYNNYYKTLISRVGNPIDFRGNRYGTSQHMEPMDFWND